jgi:hypothetical protein
VSENRVLRRINGPLREEALEDWRKYTRVSKFVPFNKYCKGDQIKKWWGM